MSETKPTKSIKVFEDALKKVQDYKEKTGVSITVFFSKAADEKIKRIKSKKKL